jgi:hypothetical protein
MARCAASDAGAGATGRLTRGKLDENVKSFSLHLLSLFVVPYPFLWGSTVLVLFAALLY